jgi:hypothetical protein
LLLLDIGRAKARVRNIGRAIARLRTAYELRENHSKINRNSGNKVEIARTGHSANEQSIAAFVKGVHHIATTILPAFVRY